MNHHHRKHARLTSFLRKALKPFFALCALTPVFALQNASAAIVVAGTLYWDQGGTGTSGNWDKGATTNWSTTPPATAPNMTWSDGNVAQFSGVGGNVTVIANVAPTALNFTTNGYTITASPTFTLTISGAGITNTSGGTQNFVAAVSGAGAHGTISFTNGATAGTMTAFTANGAAANVGGGGLISFSNTSTAGSATITNNGGAVSGANGGSTQFYITATAGSGTFTTNGGAVSGAAGASTQFFNNSTAGSGTFTTNGSTVLGANGGFLQFNDNSTAGSATFTTNGGTVIGALAVGSTQFFGMSSAASGTFTNNGSAVSGGSGGLTQFLATSTAGSATLIANGGSGGGSGGGIFFDTDSTGGTAAVKVFGNGFLDISNHNAPGVTIGSLEGTGNVFLGARSLTVGSNNLSSTFSGVISDAGGAVPASGGSLTKIGQGTLTLSGANTYTGGTTITGGLINFQNVRNFGSPANITLNGGGLQFATGNTTDISFWLNAIGAGGGTFDTNGNNVALAGVLKGVGGVTKVGAGTLTLVVPNTYSGGTFINGGVAGDRTRQQSRRSRWTTKLQQWLDTKNVGSDHVGPVWRVGHRGSGH